MAVFGVTAAMLTSLAASANPGLRYFYPATIAVLALIGSLSGASMHRAARAALGLLALFALMHGVHRDVLIWKDHLAFAERFRARMNEVIPPEAVVVYSFRSPVEAVALASGEGTPDHAEINRAYPRQGWFLPWQDSVVLPAGHSRWDYTVISVRAIDRFPQPLGEHIDSIGLYEIYAAPDE
jgi:hypothetical protein